MADAEEGIALAAAELAADGVYDGVYDVAYEEV
jgi:hypothetical protein